MPYNILIKVITDSIILLSSSFISYRVITSSQKKYDKRMEKEGYIKIASENKFSLKEHYYIFIPILNVVFLILVLTAKFLYDDDIYKSYVKTSLENKRFLIKKRDDDENDKLLSCFEVENENDRNRLLEIREEIRKLENEKYEILFNSKNINENDKGISYQLKNKSH